MSTCGVLIFPLIIWLIFCQKCWRCVCVCVCVWYKQKWDFIHIVRWNCLWHLKRLWLWCSVTVLYKEYVRFECISPWNSALYRFNMSVACYDASYLKITTGFSTWPQTRNVRWLVFYGDLINTFLGLTIFSLIRLIE